MKLPDQAGGNPRQLEFELPATHSYSRVGRQLVRAFAKLDGLGDAAVEELVLVTSELLSNVVDHGGGEAARDHDDAVAGMRLRLALEISADGWTISVSDQGGGQPADLEPLLTAELEVALTDERGRGFFLMRQLADEIEVLPSDDGLGLRVTVVKRTPARRDDASGG